MAWAYAAGTPNTLTQTGTDANINGLIGQTGVTQHNSNGLNILQIDRNTQIIVQGTLTHSDFNTILDVTFDYNYSPTNTPATYAGLEVDGGNLNIGSETTVNGVLYNPLGLLIRLSALIGIPYWALNGIRAMNAGNIDWYSGTIWSRSSMGLRDDATANTLTIHSAQCVFMDDVLTVNPATTAGQPRAINSLLASGGVVINGLTVDGTTNNRNLAITLSDGTPTPITGVNFRSGAVTLFSSDISSSFPVSLVEYENVSFAGNRNTRDVGFNVNVNHWPQNSTKVQPAKIVNSDVGSALTCRQTNTTSFSYGVATAWQRIAETVVDTTQTDIQGVKRYIKSTDDGNRRAVTGAGNAAHYNSWNFGSTDFDIYTSTSDVSGVFADQEILLGAYLADTTSGRTVPDEIIYNDTGTAGQDFFTRYYYKYGYLVASPREQINQNSNFVREITLLDNQNITEATKATVDAYTTLDDSFEINDSMAAFLDDNWLTGNYTAILYPRSGSQTVLDGYTLIVDATASQARSLAGTVLTVKSSTFTGGATAVASETVTVRNGALLNGGTFDCDINYESGTGTTLTDINCTGAIDFDTAGSYDIDGNGTINEVTNSSGGAVTLNIEAGVTITTNTGPNITIVTPQGSLDFTGLIAGSQIVVCNTGTQTEVYRNNSTGTSENTGLINAGTYDYTIRKTDYFEIRVTGVVIAASPVPVQAQQVFDRAYAASSGLTFGTTATINTTTKEFAVTVATEVQNWYSFWKEAYIAESSLVNVANPLTTFGSTAFVLTDGYEFTSASLQYLSRDGFSYEDTAGATTARWCAILSQGVTAGLQVEYQQVSGAAPTDAQNTGDIDQVVQFFGDVTHGNFDYSGYLKLKVQANGYREARSDVVATFGTVEETLYVVSLTTTAISGLTLGDPAATGITITKEPTPVSYDAGDGPKDYSITILDSGTNSADTILRELNWNLAQDATYQGLDPFDWPEMVLDAGASYETIRGPVESDGTPALHGVFVTRDGTNPHPGFARFQADDGTYGVVPVFANVSVTGMPTAGNEIRLQIINNTAVTASAWQASTAYSSGDKVLRTTGVGSENTAGLYFVATTAGTSGGTEPTWDTVVNNTTADGTVTWTCYAILYYDADPAGASLALQYTDGEQWSAGDSFTLRFAELNGATSFKTYSTTGLTQSTGFSVAVAEVSDDVYASNAIDGSSTAVTDKFTVNYTATTVVLDTNQDFQGIESYAFYCYELTVSAGMYLFWEAIDALDAANYRINVSIADINFDETAGFVKQTDNVRIFKSDGTRPALDPTTGGSGIEINWKLPVSLQETGVSGLTPTESTQLANAAQEATLNGTETKINFLVNKARKGEKKLDFIVSTQ